MANIQTITHGEPNWDTKVNSNFQALVSSVANVGGVIKDLQWTERTNAGIVLSSGFTFSNFGPNGYETLKLGNKTFVHLTLHLQCSEAFHGSGHGNIITVPDSIGFEYSVSGIVSAKYAYGISDATHINMDTIGDTIQDWDTGNSLYVIDILYVKNNS